jgi:hypothetical protein
VGVVHLVAAPLAADATGWANAGRNATLTAATLVRRDGPPGPVPVARDHAEDELTATGPAGLELDRGLAATVHSCEFGELNPDPHPPGAVGNPGPTEVAFGPTRRRRPLLSVVIHGLEVVPTDAMSMSVCLSRDRDQTDGPKSSTGR